MFIDLGQDSKINSELTIFNVKTLKLLGMQYGIDLVAANSIYRLAKLLLIERKMFSQPDKPATYSEILHAVYASFQSLVTESIAQASLTPALSTLETPQAST